MLPKRVNLHADSSGQMEVRASHRLRREHRPDRGWAQPSDDIGIRIIVAQNLAEIRSCFRHRDRSSLAESDAVSVADSFQNDLIALDPGDEVIA